LNLSLSVPASILNVSAAITVNALTDAVLECTVEGNPLGGSTVTWSLTSSSNAESGGALPAAATVDFDAATGTSRLRIARSSPTDAGDYRCTAFNGIGSPDGATVQLTVLCKFIEITAELMRGR